MLMTQPGSRSPARSRSWATKLLFRILHPPPINAFIALSRFEIEFMNAGKNRADSQHAFTFVELVTILATIAVCAVVVLPALARSRNTGATAQCRNNLRQLASAWTMYSADNGGKLVSAYPSYAGFKGSWCQGNASGSGESGAYVYGGSDPAGITNGLLWPYVKLLESYRCPADIRIAATGIPAFRGKPILRSFSMNSYMAGMSFGVSPQFQITNPSGAQNPNAPVLLKESEISRPAKTWVILEEDSQSINDGLFLINMSTARLVDLPSRLHRSGYGINFADGHVENIKLNDPASLTWDVGENGGVNDWHTLTNITTSPLN
jgi:hypothetical protein